MPPAGRQRMLGDLRVLTFNLLAPIYKRVSGVRGARESDDVAVYRARHLQLIQLILTSGADIVCLQEFWFNPALTRLYEEALGSHYEFYYLQRTGRKGDGLATLTARSVLVAEVQELRIGGDRVALLLRVSPTAAQREEVGLSRCSFLLLNTHLSFNHGALWDEYLRSEQAKKLTRQVDDYARRARMEEAPVVLAGDFNGSEDVVIHHLKKEGFHSTYAAARGPASPVTHLTHNNDEMQADYIFLRTSRPPSANGAVHDHRGLASSWLRGEEEGHLVGTCAPPAHLVLRVAECHVLPEELPVDRWPHKEFVISDHRPLCTKFEMETFPTLPA